MVRVLLLLLATTFCLFLTLNSAHSAPTTTRVAVRPALPTISPNNFTISASPNSESILQGGSGTSTILTVRTSGAVGLVSLSVSAAPTGLTASLSPSSVLAGNSSTLTIGVAASVALGTYWLNVTGIEGNAIHSASVLVTVISPFTISASPMAVGIPQGGNGTSTIGTAVTSGAAGSVSLSVSGAPAGVTASLNPASVIAGGSATLTIGVGASVAFGSYPLTVTGTEGGAVHGVTVTVIVGAGGAIVNGDFETGGLQGWAPSGAAVSMVNSGCHGGTSCVRLGSTVATNGDSALAQTFTAPTGASVLSFWYKETCPDAVRFDWATATLLDTTTGATTTLLAKVCATTSWTQAIGAVTPGHTYTLTLTSHDDNYSSDPTYTLFDDVALQ